MIVFSKIISTTYLFWGGVEKKILDLPSRRWAKHGWSTPSTPNKAIIVGHQPGKFGASLNLLLEPSGVTATCIEHPGNCYTYWMYWELKEGKNSLWAMRNFFLFAVVVVVDPDGRWVEPFTPRLLLELLWTSLVGDSLIKFIQLTDPCRAAILVALLSLLYLSFLIEMWRF